MSNAKGAAQEVEPFFIRALTRGKPRTVEIGAPDTDPIAGVFETITQSILRHVGTAMKDEELAQLLRSDRVLVRTMPPAGIEALTMWIAPQHVVAVNRGLALFLYRLARAFSPHVIVRGPNDPPAPPESQTAGIIASLLDWMGSPVRAPLVEDWPVGQREARTAENFAIAAESFVVAHEIGHIMHRHLIADVANVDLAQRSPLSLDTRPIKQEIEADVTGTILSIESMEMDGYDKRAAVTGIYFFFRALHLCEIVGAVQVDETHLPAQQRLELCDQAIGTRYQSLAPKMREYAHWADDLLWRLAKAALKERDQRRTVAAARIDEVLRTKTWRWNERFLEPDKALLDEMLALMSQSPSAVVEALDANLVDSDTYKQLFDAASSSDALDQDGRWWRHQIAHFIARHAPIEVKQALGVEFPFR